MKVFSYVHRNLTLLFTGIAGLILIAVSLAWLYMSEKEWHEKSFLAFLNTSNTILSNLNNQDTIRMSWLTTVSENNDFIIAVYDNDTLLSSSGTGLSKSQKKLAASTLAAVRDDLNKAASTSPDFSPVRKALTVVSDEGITYYSNTALFKTSHSPLCAVILYSTGDLVQQLSRQRILFFIGTLTGILVLFIFTYFFIGKLLSPIRENQRQQTEFIAAASHELRTPLAVILSSVSAYRKADAETGEKFLATIENEGRRMSALINDLLLLMKTNSSLSHFAMEQTELDTLLLDSFEAFLPLTSEAGIHLNLVLPDDAVPTCRCDAARISQLLGILLSNAISYGSPGGYITLSLRCESFCFLIVTEDNGCGISDDAKPHIFDRFYREDPSRSHKEHFGLGLCIAKQITDAHHGRIRVSDTPGGGATFTVSLPRS